LPKDLGESQLRLANFVSNFDAGCNRVSLFASLVKEFTLNLNRLPRLKFIFINNTQSCTQK